MLMAGCSKNEPVSPPDENAWVNDINLPVPIQFGSSDLSVTTKATINGMIDPELGTNKLPAGLDIGVLGFNREAEVWNDPTRTSYLNPSELLVHKHAVSTSEGNIKFEETVYYPLGSERRYDFYAYYPVLNVPKSEVTLSVPNGVDISQVEQTLLGNQVVVKTYDIGYIDILWASTVTVDAENKEFEVGDGTSVKGYNAKYIRSVKQAELEDQANAAEYQKYYPNLNFKHCLSAAQFFVKATDEKTAQELQTNGFKVTGLTIQNVWKDGVLILAIKNPINDSKGKPINEGDVIGRNVDKESFGDMVLSMKDGKNIPSVVLTNYPQELGEGLMLVPGSATYGPSLNDKDENVWHIVGKMAYIINGNPGQQEVEFKVSENNNFKAGYRYKFTIVIKSPDEVEIKAGLDRWQDGFGETNGTGEEGNGEPFDESGDYTGYTPID